MIAAPAPAISTMPGPSATASPIQLLRSHPGGRRMAAASTAIASVTRAASRRISCASGLWAGSQSEQPETPMGRWRRQKRRRRAVPRSRVLCSPARQLPPARAGSTRCRNRAAMGERRSCDDSLAAGAWAAQHAHRKRKAFFSEEKKQKTFISLSRFSPAASAHDQKFFGSFFQKRTARLVAG